MIKTVTTKQGKVSFLFGVRFITLLQKALDIKNLEDIGKQLEAPTFEDVATMLMCAHENACFYNRKDLVIENVDWMLLLIDELGVAPVMELLTDGLSELMAVEKGAKKKAKPAKPA